MMTLSGQVNNSIITYSSITKEQLKNPKYYNILHHYQNRTQKIQHPYLQEHSKGGNATQKGTTSATWGYRWWEQQVHFGFKYLAARNKTSGW